MNIDERLEKLAQRHEALTQSIELLTHDVHDMQGFMGELRKVIGDLAGSVKSTTRDLTESIKSTNGNLKKTQEFVNEIAEGTARLLHVAQVHEKRSSKLEGQED